MPSIKGVEPVHLLSDRLGIADFSREELEVILGESADQQLSRDNFNWIGAYLVEQAGLRELELTEWFKGSAASLEGERPIDVWGHLEGFIRVFNYARDYKQAVAEDLGEADGTVVRSHDIANSALDIINRGFEVAGVQLEEAEGPGEVTHAIWNPDQDERLMVRWKRLGVMEDYRVTLSEGGQGAMYYIVRYLPPGELPQIWQSGVVPMYDGQLQPSSTDSDLDGRPPSAGEVASLIVPLANEVKSRSLVAF